MRVRSLRKPWEWVEKDTPIPRVTTKVEYACEFTAARAEEVVRKLEKRTFKRWIAVPHSWEKEASCHKEKTP